LGRSLRWHKGGGVEFKNINKFRVASIFIVLINARSILALTFDNQQSLVPIRVTEIVKQERCNLKIEAPLLSSGFPTTIDAVKTKIDGNAMQVLMEGHVFGPIKMPWTQLKQEYILEVPGNIDEVNFGNGKDTIWLRNISESAERLIGPEDLPKYQLYEQIYQSDKYHGNISHLWLEGTFGTKAMVYSKEEIREAGDRIMLCLFLKPIRPSRDLIMRRNFKFDCDVPPDINKVVFGSIVWDREKMGSYPVTDRYRVAN
jgi:hypothetical protein